ncbi:hypothetical protein G195_002658 [Phytophthora kernoviae 00238/432]|uniref:VOC domain-containing protein n=1 Tax=Phytophthora kernoviae 00238/432 TaxID=1284355 RepID=A0A8J4SES4_9STRA|nr:hypothetical protein G195_002658 [Phytophthora kernoviae 00238/432]
MLARAQDPEKTVNEYMRSLSSDLGQVKAETAAVLSDESRAKRALDECTAEIKKLQRYAEKSAESGDEDKARGFLEKKAEQAEKRNELQAAYDRASAKAKMMNHMHEKLVADMGQLESRHAELKGRMAAVNAQQQANERKASASSANASFKAMEDKANQALNEAEALAELRAGAQEDDLDVLIAHCGRQDNIEQLPDPLKKQVFTENEVKEYHCNSCGADIVTEPETSATTCSFCGAAVVLSDRLTGDLAPAMVIPFSIMASAADSKNLIYDEANLLNEQEKSELNALANEDDMIFWKWSNREIKKGSKLIIRSGQDAIFLNNGKVEGIFEDEGSFNIDSEIIPFLSTLKGFKFGFNSGMRVEVLFVNTKEFTVRWGTQSPVLIPTPQLPGGMPIRANGTFNFKVSDYVTLIDKIAGIKQSYLVEDVKIRITSVLDQLLMKWISREGKDMFNLQANASDIAKGIQEDLDMQMMDIGIGITGFQVMSFNYPQEIQDMITKTASHEMIGNLQKYQQVSMTDGISSGGEIQMMIPTLTRINELSRKAKGAGLTEMEKVEQTRLRQEYLQTFRAGIHHITAFAGDPQTNVDFYAGVLGLRLVKKTINFDAPDVYHLYFGDENGSPGTIITFFPSAGSPRGKIGGGQVGITSYVIPPGTIGFWQDRLEQYNIEVTKTNRFNEELLQFEDSEGLRLELVEREEGAASTWVHEGIPADKAIKGFGGAVLFSVNPQRTMDALAKILGFTKVDEDEEYVRFRSNGDIGNVVDVPVTRMPLDEPAESLGQKLMLPEWFEPYRAQIEGNLQPIQVRNLEPVPSVVER